VLRDKLSRFDHFATFDSVSEDESDPPRYLIFKGFMSTDGFQTSLSESSRNILETPIIDENGNRINTPGNWFISGHNLPEKVKK